MGLRSVAETSLAAIVGGVEQAVQHFDGEGGLCTQLAPILGDMSQSADRLQNRRGVSNSVAISKTGSFTIQQLELLEYEKTHFTNNPSSS